MPESEKNVVVRPVRNTDIPALADLMVQLGYPTSPAEMQQRLKRIESDPRYRTFVAEKQEKICGVIGTVAQVSYEHNDDGGRILALVVDENARGSGVGQSLVAAAERDFRERKISRVALDTRFEREDAHIFYERLGYRRNGFRFVKSLS